MNGGVAVSDASPLIALLQIDRLDLLRDQFERVLVPPGIEVEVAPSVGVLPTWVSRQWVHVAQDFLPHLDHGEREAIALAVQLGSSFLVVDDLPARHAAMGLGLRIMGTLGLLVRAKQVGLIDQVQPLMDAMISQGLFASERIYREILELAGEDSFLIWP